MCYILAMHSKTMCQITLKSIILEDSMGREEDRLGVGGPALLLFPLWVQQRVNLLRRMRDRKLFALSHWL